MPLEYLKRNRMTKMECKNKLGWKTDKLAIAIGYNASPKQQHISILDQFSDETMKEFVDKIQLIFPITYGGNKEYKQQLLSKIKQLPFAYYIYDAFLNDEQIAYLRKASDIMLQLQSTDQCSGSMLEHLYTNNVVITGNWLPYDSLKDNKLWFIEVSTIEELKGVIIDVIENYKDYSMKTLYNTNVVMNLFSWDKNIEDWYELYMK